MYTLSVQWHHNDMCKRGQVEVGGGPCSGKGGENLNIPKSAPCCFAWENCVRKRASNTTGLCERVGGVKHRTGYVESTCCATGIRGRTTGVFLWTVGRREHMMVWISWEHTCKSGFLDFVFGVGWDFLTRARGDGTRWGFGATTFVSGGKRRAW